MDKKAEALKRMEKIGIMNSAVNKFCDGEILKSERLKTGSTVLGILYELSDHEKEAVIKFEDKYNALVYHVIHTNMEFGTVLDFLYVSNNEEEWAMDFELLDGNESLVYSYAPPFSEFGYIGFEEAAGGVIRTY